MDISLAPPIVTFAYFFITSLIGWRIGKANKPYGKVKLVFHILLFLGVVGGSVSMLLGLFASQPLRVVSIVTYSLVTLGALLMFATGVAMVAGKERKENLAAVHKILVWILGAALVAGFVFAALKI